VVSPTDLARSLGLADLRRLDPYPAPSGADVTSMSRSPESEAPRR
jgi:hypothetical protein